MVQLMWYNLMWCNHTQTHYWFKQLNHNMNSHDCSILASACFLKLSGAFLALSTFERLSIH